MLRIVPRYLERLDPHQDRTRQMFESLGITAGTQGEAAGGSVLLRVPADAGWARQLVARQVLDLLVRLQPLVAKVCVESIVEREVLSDLPDRFPVEVGEEGEFEGLVLDIGEPTVTGDLSADGAGWCLAIDAATDADHDRNPIGPLAAAAVATGEVFKRLFKKQHPDDPFAARCEFQRGQFSFFDYSASAISPGLADEIRLDPIVVGVGGVGSGLLTAFRELGDRLTGRLVFIDDDKLDIYNLNRVTYAKVTDAEACRLKIAAATEYLEARAHAVEVIAEPTTYKIYARGVGQRADRLFELVLTGVDDDQIRWEVQRDLPRILIDGATGAQANCRVDQIEFGAAGCIGCARPPRPPLNGDPAECDAPPTGLAPSISFNSALAGVLVAGEAIKVAMGCGAVRSFDHFFAYPLNPDLAGVPSFHQRCPVSCRDSLVLSAYRTKWG